MSEEVRAVFAEVAGNPTDVRAKWYARRQVPTEIRAEVESLLGFDTSSGESLTGRISGAAEQFLISNAPVSDEGRCGPYRLIRLLGNGGMGAVYLAERADGEVQQQVAIKFVRAGHDLPSFRNRFLRERQILASLNHPGIARLLDAGHSMGHPYLVMEFVVGTPIDEYVRHLDARAVVELFVKVAEAVSYAHRNLVIHRDLKPSNILVDSAGAPKLLDFGIAKILDASDETHTIESAMTPEYASPEQLRGDAQATTTDIYSLGAVLFRLLTGRSPRNGVQTRNDISKDLASIVTKATREEPEERYGSVDLLIADLRAWLEYRPVAARRGNTFYNARKFLRRHWLPIAAGSLALLGIAGGLLVADRERRIAERRFEQVRQLSKQFLDLDTDVRPLAGSTKARNRIVSASLQYLEALGSETRRNWWHRPGTQDADLALDIASAYLKIARVQGVPVNSNLGQFKEAKQSLSRADAFVDSVLSSADYPQRRRALLLSAEIARDSMILADTERRNDDALAYGRKAAQQLEYLLGSPGYSREQATTAAGLYVNIAQAHANLHHLEEAAHYGRTAVEIARVAGDKRQLGKALGILSNIARFSGDFDGALRSIRESRAIAEKLADPNNTETLLLVAAALWREGTLLGEYEYVSYENPDAARPLLERAFAIAEELARKDPADYTSRSYVSMAGRELGDILQEPSPARALSIYDHTRSRLNEVKNHPKARREEVWLWTGSSYALRRLGRTAEAGSRVEAALATVRALENCPGARIIMGEECEIALRAAADHYAETGNVSAAIATYEQLQKSLLASNPQPLADLRHAHNLSKLYRSLGDLYARSARPADARALQQRRVEIWRYWDHKLPGNPFIHRQLSDAEKRQISRTIASTAS